MKQKLQQNGRSQSQNRQKQAGSVDFSTGNAIIHIGAVVKMAVGHFPAKGGDAMWDADGRKFFEFYYV